MRTFMPCLLIGPVLCASAQTFPTDRGSLILGGGLSFTQSSGRLYENYRGEAQTEFIASPSLGCFTAPGLAIGAEVEFSRFSQGGYTSATWGIGPKVQYFLGGHLKPRSVQGRNYPLLGAEFLFKRITSQSPADGFGKASRPRQPKVYQAESKSTFTSFQFFAGLLHMLSGAVGVNGQLEYAMDSHRYGGEGVKGNRVAFSAGVTAFLY